MMPGEFFAIDACYCCGKAFEFDPFTVLTILIDPTTGRPSDVSAGFERLATPTCREDECVQRAICPRCTKLVNAERARMGIGPVPG